MDDARLLVFRWGAREYGIPVENVAGIIGDAAPNSRPTILLHIDGIQLAVLADAIIKVTRRTDIAGRTAGTTSATFRLYQFDQPAE